MTHIYSRLTDQVLSAIVVPALACSNRKTVQLNVAFDSAWDGLTKSAVFYTSTNPTVYEVPITSGKHCIVPEEVLVESGRLFIGIKGIHTSTGKTKASTMLNLKIMPGTPLQVVSDPTGSIYEKLLSAYGLAADEIAVERARISNLIASGTVGDAETLDLRVGADGKTYSTAGEAVRAQYKKAFEYSDVVNDEVFTKMDTEAITYTLGVAIASTGSYVTGQAYSMASLEYLFAKQTSFIKSNIDGYTFNIALYSDADKTAFISAYTGKTEFEIPYDCYVRFSLRSTDTTMELSDDSIKNNFEIAIKSERITTVEKKLEATEKIATRNAIDGKLYHVWGKRSINFDQYTKTLTIPSAFWVIELASGKRYEVADTIELDYSHVSDGAGMCFVLFDTTNSQMRIVGTNSNIDEAHNLRSRSDNELIVASFLNTRIYAVSRYVYIIKDLNGFEYTVNGLPPTLYERALFNLRLPSIPSEWFVRNSDLPFHNVSAMEYMDIYAGYDALVAKYPDYVKRTDLGNDASGVYPIYSYTFTPSAVKTSTSSDYGVATYTALHTQADAPKCVLVAGVHGHEYPSILALLNAMTLICEEFMNDDVLAFLRFNVRFVVIPLANPYGYINSTRTNANHVDINRNFDTDTWGNGVADATSNNYRGASPASESETQIIQNLINEHTDALFAYDFHSHGVWTSWDEITRWDLNHSKNSDHMFNIGTHIIQGVTKSGWKNHNMDLSSGYIGRIGLGHEYACVSDYAAHNGIETATPEVMWKYYGGSQNTVDVEQMNTEYMINAIISAIKYYLG